MFDASCHRARSSRGNQMMGTWAPNLSSRRRSQAFRIRIQGGAVSWRPDILQVLRRATPAEPKPLYNRSILNLEFDQHIDPNVVFRLDRVLGTKDLKNEGPIFKFQESVIAALSRTNSFRSYRNLGLLFGVRPSLSDICCNTNVQRLHPKAGCNG